MKHKSARRRRWVELKWDGLDQGLPAEKKIIRTLT